MPGLLSNRYDDRIASVRSRVQAAVNSLSEEERKSQFYAEDVEEINRSDYEVRRFLLDWGGREDGTVKSILKSLRWKKSMGLRDLRDNYFPADMWFIGGVFIYEPDREGRPTMHIRLKTAITTRELMTTIKQFLAYLCWKVDRSGGEAGYIVLVDFEGISIKNCDLEMARYVLEIKQVFPKFLRYLLAVDCPLIARAAWNMVKFAISPEDRHVMQMVSRAEVTKYVAPENLPPFLGGTSSRKFCGPSVVPNGSPSYVDFGAHHLGISEERGHKLFKAYQPMREEAEALASAAPVIGRAIVPA